MDVNADFRYVAGYPYWREAKRWGIDYVRCISLPEMENVAAEYLGQGIRVLAVYTGESNDAGTYVMRNCSALQIGNEPGFVYPEGDASWPTGTAEDFVNVWSHVANVLVPAVHADGLPLVGPGIWCQDYARWDEIANRLPKLSAAGVHVYPGPSGQNPTSVRSYLSRYRGIRSDLPLICSEWQANNDVLAYARAIDVYCERKFWYTWRRIDDQAWMSLYGSAAQGLLALTG